MSPRSSKKTVQVKGHPGQVAQILKKSKERKKDRHRRQHHRDHPGQGAVNTGHQDSLQPPRRPQGGKKGVQRAFQPGKSGGQQLGRIVCPGNGDPEKNPQQGQHHGDPQASGSKKAIEAPVPLVGAACSLHDNLPGNFFSGLEDSAHDEIRRLPAAALFLKQPCGPGDLCAQHLVPAKINV